MTPWYEHDSERYASEREFWLRNDFVEERQAGKIEFVGELEVAAGSSEKRLQRQRFKVRVAYPDAFPYRPPDIEFVKPRIRGSRHQSPAGVPCLFPARDWRPFDLPPSEVEKALRRWLRSWMVGSFPREQAIYELPEYFPYSSLSILLSPEGMSAFEGRESGTFSMLRATGRDLAVVKSVDRELIAESLLAGLRFHPEVPHEVVNGKWFRLHEEPSIMRYTGKLETVLRESGHTLSFSRSPASKGFVGLVFEDSVLCEERLLVLDYSANKKSQRKAQGWSLRAPWIYIVSQRELFRRLEGVRDVNILGEKLVVVLGIGAVGSSLTLDLAREGVGGFLLCDFDRLRPGNIVRHALDLFSVGQFKSDAVETAVGRVNPYAKIWTDNTLEHVIAPDVLANHMRVDHPLHPTHAVVSAIGDDAVEGLVSEVAVRTKSAPVLFVRTLHDGDAVRVMLLRPGRSDACLRCLQLHAGDDHPDLISVPDSELRPVYDAGCATAVQPGAGLASRQAAVIGAKRALAVLLEEDRDENHWLWVDRAIPDAGDVRLREPERMYAARLPVHDACPFCSG